MRNVPSESVRMGLLIALDKSPRHCMLPFVESGGVEILAKWLRKSEEACYACFDGLTEVTSDICRSSKSRSHSHCGGHLKVKTTSHIIVKMPLPCLNDGRLLVSLSHPPRNLVWIRPNAQSNRPLPCPQCHLQCHPQWHNLHQAQLNHVPHHWKPCLQQGQKRFPESFEL